MQIQNHLRNLNLNEWSIYDVASWLSFNNISKDIIDYFIDTEIDGAVLKELGRSIIKEIEILIPEALIKLHTLINSLIQYSRNKSPSIENFAPNNIFPISAIQKNPLTLELAQTNQVPPMNLEIELANRIPANMIFYSQYVKYMQNKFAIRENGISKILASLFSACKNEEQKYQLLNCDQLTLLSDPSNNLQNFQHFEITPISYIENIYSMNSSQLFDILSQHIQYKLILDTTLSIRDSQKRYNQGKKPLDLLLPGLFNNKKLQHMNQDIKNLQISEINKLLGNFHETWKHFLRPSLEKKVSNIYKYCEGKEVKVNNSIYHLLNNTIIPIVSLLSHYSLEDEDFSFVVKKLDQSICRYRVLIWIKELITASESGLSKSLSNIDQPLSSMSEGSSDPDFIWSQSNIEVLLNIPPLHIFQRESFKKILEKCQAKTPDIQLDSPDIIASIVKYLKNNYVYFHIKESSPTSINRQSDGHRSEISTSHKGNEYFNSDNSDLLLINKLYQKDIYSVELASKCMIKTNKLKHEELTEFSSQYSSEFNTNTDIKTLQNSYQDLHFSRTPKQLLDGIYSSETSIGSVQSSINEPTTIISLTSESSSESYIDDYFSAGRKRTPSEVSESSNSSSFTNDSISKRRRKSIETYEYPISGNIDYSECQAMQSSINDSKFYHQDSRPMHCSVSSNENRKDRYYWNKYGGVLNQKYISKAQSNRLIENKLNRRDLYSKSIYKRIHLPSFSFKEIPKTQKSSLSKQYTMYSKYGSAEKLDCNFVRQEIQPLSPFSNYLNTPISIKTLALNLKPHQVSGVEFLWKTVVEKGHGAILAHAMGLGKTGQVFTFLNTLSYYIRYNRNIISNSLHQFKVLILAPASLQENWINEFQKWTNYEDSSTNSSVYLPIPVSLGETPTRHRIHRLKYWAKNGGILILSHTLFKNCVQNKDYCKKQFEDILVNQPGASLVVIDEAHVLKKENTLIRKISKEFKTPARIMLTGYPMQNNLTEYWCMSKFANDSIFGSLHSFKTEYKYPINKGFYEPLGSRLRKESDRILYKLTKLLQPIVHRVNSDVIKDQIPKKVEYAVCCYLSPIQYTLYTYYMDLFNNELNKAEFLEKGCLLQTICNIPIHKDLIFSSNTGEKVDVFNEDSELEPLGSVHMKVLLDRMKDLSFNSSDIKNNPKFFILTELIQESLLVDEKLIVFSRSIKTLLAIQKWLELFTSQKTLLLTGETAMEDRQYYINCINEDDKYTILLASVSVGGVGFTVTGATRVIIYDLGYNPTVIDQAIARTFRIGQTKNVHVYRLYTFDTWEARLIALSEHKNNLILRTMDSRNSHVNSVNLKEIKRYFKVPEYRFNGERKINGEDYILGKILSKYKDFIASCVIHRDEPTEHRFDIDEAEKRAIEIEVEFAMETIDIFNE